jgi:hypothetical protein
MEPAAATRYEVLRSRFSRAWAGLANADLLRMLHFLHKTTGRALPTQDHRRWAEEAQSLLLSDARARAALVPNLFINHIKVLIMNFPAVGRPPSSSSPSNQEQKPTLRQKANRPKARNRAFSGKQSSTQKEIDTLA